LLLIVAANSATAQVHPKVVILPFSISGVDSISAQTIVGMLRREVAKNNKLDVIETGQTPIFACGDVGCASDAAKPLFAQRVVYGSFSKLGSRVIMEYTLADVSGRRRLITENIAAESIEGLQNRIAAVAVSIAEEKPLSLAETAGTQTGGGGVTPQRTTNRRYDTISMGVGFGQLFPQDGYEGASNRFFVLDSRTCLEKTNYSLNLLIGVRYGLYAAFGASYIPLKGSVSPYIGGGFGYHFVAEDISNSQFNDPEVSLSGFMGMISAGVWFLRTSDIRVFVNLDFMYTASSFDDKAVVLTLGVAGVTDAIRF
jgi:hypothetical protein